VPDGSLCTASVEQIFPPDSVRRNYFELALYIMSASPIASVRAFETVRDADVVCAKFGALPTLSVQDRAIIVLNDHRFWGYASGPSSSGNTLPSSIHGYAARRSALPRERFSPSALFGHGAMSGRSPLCAPRRRPPSGPSLCVHTLASFGSWMAAEKKFSFGFNLIWVVQPLAQKYSGSLPTQITSTTLASRPTQRGVSRSSRT
jgi:hypothetical protein